MKARKVNLFFLYLAVNACALLALLVHAYFEGRSNLPFLRERTSMVERLALTDLCLFTEARYTRNPALADLNTALQDHPLSMEHFPSGSIISPPSRVRHGLD